jgi:histidine triad (HIT) family protein
MPDPDCLFCKIVAKEIPSEVVRETANVLAFRDINPGAPTHVLVIPKEHIKSASYLETNHGDLLVELFDVMEQIGTEAGISDGYRIVTNVGPKAGQSVFHIHFHVLGGRPLSWPPG